ncbi:hypothetical protein V5799_001482 [Amblyomma americanum]|uniref:Uncharacterized protein n=1 Tax=Amblyomma americanum TaxID=6943 RepID=A0AAQ4D033_AMBAM
MFRPNEYHGDADFPDGRPGITEQRGRRLERMRSGYATWWCLQTTANLGLPSSRCNSAGVFHLCCVCETP